MTKDKKEIDIYQELNLSDLLESAKKKETYKEANSNLKFDTQLQQQFELEENSKKYPVNKSKGNSKKYTEL